METLASLVLGIMANLLTLPILSLGRRIRKELPNINNLQSYCDGAFKALCQVETTINKLTTSQQESVLSWLHEKPASFLLQHMAVILFVVDQQANVSAIRSAFVRSSSTLEFSSKDTDKIIAKIFDTLRITMSRLIKEFANKESDFAYIQSYIKKSDLTSLPHALAAIIGHTGEPLHDYSVFEMTLKKAIKFRYSRISPPQSEIARKVKIRNLYVKPYLTLMGLSSTFDDFYNNFFRAVVLGDPGGGKSTLMMSICYTLASSKDPLKPVPLTIVLREYQKAKTKEDYTFTQYLSDTVKSLYQVPEPESAIEYMLTLGRGMVIFDGLDELLETHNRQKITTQIELFCKRYPLAPVLVTSRKIGYSEAPLDQTIFPMYALKPFRREQSLEYAGRWFGAVNDLPDEKWKKMAIHFFQESDLVSDLRSNPLMLALMCNMYKRDGDIPRNRPEIFDRCTMMFFWKWDKSRGIQIEMPFHDHLRPTVCFLAYWLYNNTNITAASQNDLITKSISYLFPDKFESREASEAAAKAFLDFCRDRAWVFSDVGTTANGQNLYAFTHRAFMEYFAAEHLTRTHETVAELMSTLDPWIKKREKDVVAQLAIQIKSKQSEGAANRIISSIVSSTSSNYENTDAYLSFAARSLHFLVPSPAILRQLVSECVKSLVIRGSKQIEKLSRGNGRANTFDAFLESDIENKRQIKSLEEEDAVPALLDAALENAEIVREATISNLIKYITLNDKDKQLVAFDVLGLIAREEVPLSIPSRISQVWAKQATEAMWQNKDNCIQLAKMSRRAAQHCCLAGIISINDLVSWYGISSLREQFDSIAYSNRRPITIIEECVHAALYDKNRSWLSKENGNNWLGALGAIFLSYPIDLADLSKWVGSNIFLNISEYKDPTPTLDKEGLFGAFIMLGLLISRKQSAFRKKHSSPIWDRLKPIFFDNSGKFVRRNAKYINKWGHSLSFNAPQLDLVEKILITFVWSNRQ